MRALCVMVATPALDDDFRFGQAVEDLAVVQLVADFCVEALAVAILPRVALLDVGCPGAYGSNPLPTAVATNSRPLALTGYSLCQCHHPH